MFFSLRYEWKNRRAHLGDNCIQNVHLGNYIVGYMVGNFVLRRRVSGAVKRHLRPYNRLYTSPNEHFEYGYPHSNALFNTYSSKAQHFAPNWSFVSNVKQLRQPITSNVSYDVGAATVYRRIYWRKFLTLSNQTSRYIRKCIRISYSGQCARRFFHSYLKETKKINQFLNFNYFVIIAKSLSDTVQVSSLCIDFFLFDFIMSFVTNITDIIRG